MITRRRISLAFILFVAVTTAPLWRNLVPADAPLQVGTSQPAAEKEAWVEDLPVRTQSSTPGISSGIIYGSSEAVRPSASPDPLVLFDDWVARFVEAPAETDPALIREGRELAALRRAAMVRLIRDEPEQALARAISRQIQALLPEEITSELEIHFDAHGDLEVLVLCGDEEHDHSHDPVSRHLTLPDERLEAFVYGRREGQATKYDLPVHGIKLDGVAALHESPVRSLSHAEAITAGAAPGEIALRVGEELVMVDDPEVANLLESEIIAAEGALGPDALHGAGDGATIASTNSWTTGEKRVLYIRVGFPNRTGAPVSSEAAATTMAEVDSFFRENSGNRASLTTTVVPSVVQVTQTTDWYRNAGYLQLRDDALAAARAFDQQDGGTGRFNPDQYDLYILAFSSVFPGWGGRAVVGGRGVWLNGFFDAGITAHEIGHNLGVFHANGWEAAEAAPAGDGRHLEYADRFDVMGISSNIYNGRFQDGHFNPWFKAYLGWIAPEDTLEVRESGIYRIHRHDHPEATGLRALTIPADEGRAYWLGVRRLFDSNTWLMNGIDVRWANTVYGNMSSQGSQLLDMNPLSTSGFDDHALVSGKTFGDAARSIRIRPVALGGQGAEAFVDVEITIGDAGAPIIASQPKSRAAMEGEAVAFAVEVSGTSSTVDYQWFKNGVSIANAIAATYQIGQVTVEDAGSYTVRVRNSHGSTTSASGVLTVKQEGSIQPGSVDAGFDALGGPNGPVYSIVSQPDGSVLIGGNFTQVAGVSRNRIARLLPDGSVDPSFDPGSGFDQNVWTLALQSDGRILVGGLFTRYDGSWCNRIARLHADGSLDESFNVGSGADQAVRAFAIQNGRILVGGAFTSFNGAPSGGLIRLYADGSVDDSFRPGSGADGAVWSLALHNGGIYAGGAFSSFSGHPRQGVVRLLDNGAVDSSFNPGQGGNGAVYSMLPEPTGGVVAAGSFTTFGGHAAQRIVRLLPDGSVDSDFSRHEGADDFIWSLVRQEDGRILAGGWFNTFGGESRRGIARLNRDGSLDTSFEPGTGANDFVWPLALQADGSIIVGGRFTQVDGVPRMRVAKLYGEGSVANPAGNPHTFATWALDAGIPADQATPQADPGSAGVPNLLRYAFGLDPVQPDRRNLPFAGKAWDSAESSTTPYLTLTFTRRAEQNDLIYTIEASEDLTNWTPLQQAKILQILSLGTTEQVTIRDDVPLSGSTRFLRVKVTLSDS
jgi:uncharacterized delta-60 repeat protein